MEGVSPAWPEPAQAALLDEICAAPLLTKAALTAAGALAAAPGVARKTTKAVGQPDLAGKGAGVHVTFGGRATLGLQPLDVGWLIETCLVRAWKSGQFHPMRGVIRSILVFLLLGVFALQASLASAAALTAAIAAPPMVMAAPCCPNDCPPTPACSPDCVVAMQCQSTLPQLILPGMSSAGLAVGGMVLRDMAVMALPEGWPQDALRRPPRT